MSPSRLFFRACNAEPHKPQISQLRYADASCLGRHTKQHSQHSSECVGRSKGACHVPPYRPSLEQAYAFCPTMGCRIVPLRRWPTSHSAHSLPSEETAPAHAEATIMVPSERAIYPDDATTKLTSYAVNCVNGPARSTTVVLQGCMHSCWCMGSILVQRGSQG